MLVYVLCFISRDDTFPWNPIFLSIELFTLSREFLKVCVAQLPHNEKIAKGIFLKLSCLNSDHEKSIQPFQWADYINPTKFTSQQQYLHFSFSYLEKLWNPNIAISEIYYTFWFIQKGYHT